MRTRNGIYYNLAESPYRLKVGSVEFVFSSQLYRQKFSERRKLHRDEFNAALTKRYGYSVDVGVLSDLVLYRKIEKRGFLIVVDSEVVQWQDNITCGGMMPTVRKLSEK